MEKPSSATGDPGEPEPKRSIIASLIVGVLGTASVVYLFNPGAGIFELIPDIVPVFGNLDEAAATALLISSLAYFGLDLGRLFGRSDKSGKSEDTPAVDVEAEIVERD